MRPRRQFKSKQLNDQGEDSTAEPDGPGKRQPLAEQQRALTVEARESSAAGLTQRFPNVRGCIQPPCSVEMKTTVSPSSTSVARWPLLRLDRAFSSVSSRAGIEKRRGQC